MAMPWSRAKQIAAALRGQGPFPEGYEGSRNLEQLNALFNACFRIQLEASQAAGRHIPLVIENVKGAQPWVGRAKANYGSYYLWGDVESVGGRIVAPGAGFGAAAVRAQLRVQKFNPDGTEHPQGSWFVIADSKERGARKGPGGDWFEDGRQGQDACSAAIKNADTAGRTWFGISHGREYEGQSGNPVNGTKGFATGLGRGHARKAASAMIAKIPFELASHIARCFKPVRLCAVRQNE